jgi:hypothetical protein
MIYKLVRKELGWKIRIDIGLEWIDIEWIRIGIRIEIGIGIRIWIRIGIGIGNRIWIRIGNRNRNRNRIGIGIDWLIG